MLKRLWTAARAAIEARDLCFAAGLALVAVGLVQVSTVLALLSVGSILIFVALRR